MHNAVKWLNIIIMVVLLNGITSNFHREGEGENKDGNER
jgi:hypothetical protein